MANDTKQNRKKDIAIIGMAGRFPKSDSIQEFWSNLVGEEEMIHFYSDDELRGLGIGEQIIADPTTVKIDGSIKRHGQFDYSFFNYTYDEAVLMDPQMRILHEAVWHSLEDAGYNPYSYKGNIGLFLSASENLHWQAYSLMNQNDKVNPFFHGQIANKNFANTLISYKLNLRGPSYALDTACSSSLVGIHLASRSLLMRECSIAIAGGVSINCEQSIGYPYEEGGIFSRDGKCRTFDANSSGTIPGDGAGIVVLKRLEEALNDRDNIYAVIKSSAVNNDGNRKAGFTAPSIQGQSGCIKMAQRVANVTPESISYIEAHGTATALGDPIEIEALNKAFDYNKEHQCAIGSVKSNVGHLDVAAGVAGVIKTALALDKKELPASRHFETPNPDINFAGGPFYVNTATKEWKSDLPTPLRAGVSSFGIGGTNAHVILEEAPALPKASISRMYQLLPISAKSGTALDRQAKSIARFLESSEAPALSDISFTLATGRESFNSRKAAIGKDLSEIATQLKQSNSANLNESNSDKTPQIAFLFPGQGSQYFEMAKGLYETEADFRSTIDQGLELLSSKTGEDYAAILGLSEGAEDQEKINNTKFTQPLLFVVEYALAKLLSNWGVQPNFLLGHSLGEYAAACLSGVFTFEAGIEIIVQRANLIAGLEHGTMLAIDAPQKEVEAVLIGQLSIAASNTKDNCVVSGPTTIVREFENTLKEHQLTFTELKTSHAFHSEMMEPILQKFQQVLNDVELSAPTIPIISNLTGKILTEAEAKSPQYWVDHLRKTVKFTDCAAFLLQQNNLVAVEVGPGKTLSALLERNSEESHSIKSVQLLRHPKLEIHDQLQLVRSVGVLWEQGVPLNWTNYFSNEVRNRVSLPGYAFEPNEFPVKVNPFADLPQATTHGEKRAQEDWYYLSNWKKAAPVSATPVSDKLTFLFFLDEAPLATALVESLRSADHKVILVRRGQSYLQLDENSFVVNALNSEDFDNLYSQLEEQGIEVGQIVYNWNTESAAQEKVTDLALSLIHSCRRWNVGKGAQNKLTLLGHFNQLELDLAPLNVAGSALMSLAQVIAQEEPELFATAIDCDDSSADPLLIASVTSEFEQNFSELNIAYRKGIRWQEAFDQVQLNASNKTNYLTEGKNYVITGGLGQVALTLATHLCEAYNAKVSLLGRSEIPNQSEWEKHLNDDQTDDVLRAKLETLVSLQTKGQGVSYYQVDVSKRSALSKTIAKIENEIGPIAGVLHTAGNTSADTFGAAHRISREDLQEQFAPKIDGCINLHEVFKERNVDFVWLTSSLSTVLGGATYGAYATANKFMNAFAQSGETHRKNWFSISLDGINDADIPLAALPRIFEESFSIGANANLIVSSTDLNHRLETAVQHNIEQSNNTNSIEEPKRQSRPALSADYVAPSGEIEERLCEIWQDFFRIDGVGVEDNFLEIGGDSLKAISIGKLIFRELDIEINPKEFYDKLTIREIAGELRLAMAMKKMQKNQDKDQKRTEIRI